MTTREKAALFVLREALALGIRVGTDGDDDLLLLAPLRIPRESRRTFEHALEHYRAEVISIIMRGVL
jgi:hypothetical protein